ncbi:hypothetical protein Btru_023676 [Bulinus truncatus]|nr:hypothetical protein Btru_023676 [Bulinus truncatus]
MSGFPDFSQPPPPFFQNNNLPMRARLPHPNFRPHFPSFLPPPPGMAPMMNGNIQRPFVQQRNQSWNSFQRFSNGNAGRPMPHYSGQTSFNSFFPNGQGAANESFPHSAETPQFSTNNTPAGSSNNGKYWHHQRGGKHEGLKKKKEKIDKRLLPENNVFFCDICDRGFKNEELYKQHTDGHIKCTYRDCPFFAAPKLVQLHMSMQHKGGLAKKVWGLESDDDVSKWREERKKNFPTLENIERKKTDDAEKLARGERIQIKDFSKFGKDRGRGRGRRRGQDNRRGRGRWGRNRGNRFNDDFHTEDQKSDSDDDAPPEEIKLVKEIIASNQVGTLEASTEKSETVQENNSGLGLLAYYGDSSSDSNDSEEDDGVPKMEPAPLITETTPAAGQHVPRENLLPNPFAGTPPAVATSVNETKNSSGSVTPCRDIIADDSSQNTSHLKAAPVSENEIKQGVMAQNADTSSGSVKLNNFSSENQDVQNNSRSPGRGDDIKNRKYENQRRNRDNDRGDHPAIKRRRMKHDYTLLEKMLAPDIRRERNKILQCVHYIVQHKFFAES